MNPIVWILLSIVINRSSAQYGPYHNVVIAGYKTDFIGVLRSTVPGVPNGQAMVGSRMLSGGQYYEIKEYRDTGDSWYYWTISPIWVPPGGSVTVQFVPPDVDLEFVGWQPIIPMTVCQGDCDDDRHCRGELICVHDRVPDGCTGTALKKADYCGDRNLNAAAVEGNDGEEFEGSEDDTEGLAENGSNAGDSELLLLPIGAVAIIMVIIGVVFMMKRNGKNKAKGQEKEMNKVVDAPNVVHVQEVSNATADAMDAEEAGQERTAAV